MTAVVSPVLLDTAGLQALIDVLREDGREVYGPTVRAGAVQTTALTSVDQLPVGWHDEQAPGHYRLTPDAGPARFAWAVGPQTWKPLLHPPHTRTVTIRRRPTSDGAGEQLDVEPEPLVATRAALLGLRPCDLAAVERLDHVLGDGVAPEPVYAARRQDTFLVVVECTAPADTCFCTSMGTGPGVVDAEHRHDLTLTELVDGDDVRYLARPASRAGEEVLAAVGRRRRPGDAASGDAAAPEAPADAVERAVETAADAIARAAASIRRTVDGAGLHDELVASHEHPGWDDVAERCLACGNCTAVCPTCFCTDVVDVTDLSNQVVERWRTWSTCFDPEFTRLGARRVRTSIASRYRQWLTHKLATWHDQFGESGCVGCGRCIAWCPVGIDLTREVTALRAPARRAEAR